MQKARSDKVLFPNIPSTPGELPPKECEKESGAWERARDLDTMAGDQRPLWTPAPGQATPMDLYRQHINRKFNQSLRDSHELQSWSVKHRHEFWIDLWNYVGLIPSLPPGTTKAYDDRKSIQANPPFFEGVRINYTENVLTDRNPNAVALIGLREGQSLDGEKWTWAELTENVRRVRSALIRRGIRREDVVAAVMSNSNWIIGMRDSDIVHIPGADGMPQRYS
jgi:acetoacetyl-CoA synthetase